MVSVQFLILILKNKFITKHLSARIQPIAWQRATSKMMKPEVELMEWKPWPVGKKVAKVAVKKWQLFGSEKERSMANADDASVNVGKNKHE